MGSRIANITPAQYPERQAQYKLNHCQKQNYGKEFRG